MGVKGVQEQSRIEFDCNNCGKSCSRPYWEYKRTEQHFCSQRCAKSKRNKDIATPLPVPGTKKHSLTFLESFTENNYTWLRCRCDCGEITNIKRNKFGMTKTCNNRKNHKGKSHPMYKGYEDISASYWSSIKQHATERNLTFEITIQDAWKLFIDQDQQCALSGVTINLNKNMNEEHTASLDRIDSLKGYTADNIQWVHKCINRMKWNLSDDMFIKWCTKIAEKQSGGR